MKIHLNNLSTSNIKFEDQKKFLNLIDSEKGDFLNPNLLAEGLRQTELVYHIFKGKRDFVQIGIGGSSLGAEMLVEALKKKDCKTKFHFFNNIDPDYLEDNLTDLEPKDALFFVVSKSGSTVETLALFSVVLNWLKKHGIQKENIKNYFVFATDPQKGPLRELGKEHGIFTLDIPPHVGGRFSVLTPVGLLPALMANIDAHKLLAGALNTKEDIQNNKNPYFYALGSKIWSLKTEKNITQTVLMPYTSKLRGLSLWFVQLWAESLGKKYSLDKNIVHQGLTPIASIGVTDQHSQMQLFMEGPKDKFLMFIEIEKFDKDFDINNEFQIKTFSQFEGVSLSKLMKAELEGTLKALTEASRPFTKISLTGLNEFSLGQIIGLFELLTVFVGQLLEINPFNQPGVEAGKLFAKQYLDGPTL